MPVLLSNPGEQAGVTATALKFSPTFQQTAKRKWTKAALP